MAATLKLRHKAIGVEVRRGTFDVVVDGKRVESLPGLRVTAPNLCLGASHESRAV
jgi:hypothetical protein